MGTLDTAAPAVAAPAPAPPGFWWRVLMPVAAVAVGLVALVVSLVVALAFWSTELASAAATVVGSGVILGAALLLVRRLPPHERRRIFAAKTSPGAAAAIGISSGLGFVLLTAAVVAAGTAVDPALRARTAGIPSPFGANPWAGLLTALGIVILAPLGEELLFRGIVLRGLVRRMPFGPAAGVSGALFALCHSDVWAYLFWPRLIALAIVGVGLAALNRRRGYWCGVAAHATINGLATLALLAAG